jgi:hypothetical protein
MKLTEDDMGKIIRILAIGMLKNLPEYADAREGMTHEQAEAAVDGLLADYAASGRDDGIPFYLADWWNENKE